MALLLRKVWSSMVNRPSSSDLSDTGLQISNGIDALPPDVFFLILRFLGPKEAAKARLVSKAWKVLIPDNHLWVLFLQDQQESWDSIIFAETQLRSGFPLRLDTGCSFMHIYGQRAQLSGSVIIDGGSGYCKFGWSKYPSPSGKSATFLEFGNIESPMYSRLRHFFATIYSRMQVKPSTQPIVLSLPICHSDDTDAAKASRIQLREAIHSVLFDMNVPAVCAVDQVVLALYAARCTSGIVVNIGFQITSVVPILRGRVMHEVGVEIVGNGALKLTGFLRQLMQQRGMNFESLYTVRTLKENLCYVAADYEAELLKDTAASFEVAGEGLFTLSKERFQTGEFLFKPHMGGEHTMALHQAVALCMDHCFAAEATPDDGWFKTVVLAGGTSCLPGLPGRLEKELIRLLPASISEGIKVIPPSHGAESAWFGAKLISNVSTFRNSWCLTKKKFRRSSRHYGSFIGPW